MDKSPSVIVLMPTYNHELYVGQAIESVLIQQTNFDVDLYISDDASLDSTYTIAEKFANRNRVKIILKQNSTNIGALANGAYLRQVALESNKRYVAILEGDDYWTDSFKLQKQVDLLEGRQDISFCCHRVMELSSGSLEVDGFVASEYDLKYVIDKGRVGHTPSYMFRNYFNTQWGERALQLFLKPRIMSADRLLQLVLVYKGNICMLEDCMAVYRIHSSSMMREPSFVNDHNLAMYFLLKEFGEFIAPDFKELLLTNKIKWLKAVIIKDLSLSNKLIAWLELLTIDLLTSTNMLFTLPYYMVKATIYKRLKRQKISMSNEN